MGSAVYRIKALESGGWGVEHDGKTIGPYPTKEIALQSSFAAARRAARDGHAITISAPESEPDPSEFAEVGPITLERS
jgi:hypothetical protein